MAESTLFRAGLLAGRSIAVCGADEVGAGARCASLGARILRVGDEGAVDALIVDAASPLRALGGGLDGLRAAVDGAWDAVRAVATERWMEEGTGGGAIVLIGPAPGDGTHAAGARAALESLARTLSIEWARFDITPTVVLPGDATTPEEIADTVAFLVSEAGAYYSGCVFTLGAVPS